MADANKDEVDKCKQIARNAITAGDVEKATRFLQKAKRMCPHDSSIDALLAEASRGGASPGPSPEHSASHSGGASHSQSHNQSSHSQSQSHNEGPRFRGHAASTASSAGAPAGARTNKEGRTYTAEQASMVQRILRTKDYYDILEVPRESGEDAVKKAYKKLALKLHPDKNKAPGAEEAFKKLSKAVQCLTDAEKKQVYDRYGDEERIPQQHRQAYQQDFMTPEDLFAAFFGGGGAGFHHGGHHRHHHADDASSHMHRGQLFQALPVLLLVLLTLASNFAARDGGSRFSFSPNSQYRNERTTASLNVVYYVTDDFSEHYGEGTRALAEFDKQVEIYHVRNLHSECDYQDKLMYKKVMIAKRRGSQEELEKARNHPRPACKDIEKIKKKHNSIYRSAMYMGAY